MQKTYYIVLILFSLLKTIFRCSIKKKKQHVTICKRHFNKAIVRCRFRKDIYGMFKEGFSINSCLVSERFLAGRFLDVLKENNNFSSFSCWTFLWYGFPLMFSSMGKIDPKKVKRLEYFIVKILKSNMSKWKRVVYQCIISKYFNFCCYRRVI